MNTPMSARDVERARARFLADQDHAEYVEYTEAMDRIAPTRTWQRRRRRFLRSHGYDVVERHNWDART